jgi:hypothetical protein
VPRTKRAFLSVVSFRYGPNWSIEASILLGGEPIKQTIPLHVKLSTSVWLYVAVISIWSDARPACLLSFVSSESPWKLLQTSWLCCFVIIRYQWADCYSFSRQ